MQKFGVLVYIFTGLLIVGTANAATIYGTVYDLSLNKVKNTRVEISTVPRQVIIANNGTYLFNVANGVYSIKAQMLQKNAVVASVQENITITQDGSYVLDLILFPEIEEGVEDIELDVNGNVAGSNNIKLIVVILALVLVIAAFYYIRLRKFAKGTKEIMMNDGMEGVSELKHLTEIIKKEGGRTTQKEIRKQIPLSEAKISLMIAELEHKGVIEKIKKGRGNIIILKK